MSAPEPGSEIDGYRLGEMIHAGTPTVKRAVARSPADSSASGASAGRTVHPAGTCSAIVPCSAVGVSASARTTTSRSVGRGETGTIMSGSL